MVIKLNRKKKTTLLKWLQSGCIDTKDMEELKACDEEKIVINVIGMDKKEFNP